MSKNNRPIIVINSIRFKLYDTQLCYIIRSFMKGKFDRPTIFVDNYHNDISVINALETLEKYIGEEHNTYHKSGAFWNVAHNTINIITSVGFFYFDEVPYSITLSKPENFLCLNGESYSVNIKK